MLEARGLAVERGGRAVVRGISARFPPGTVTAVLGPNGAGKSTLLEALAGLRRVATGEVLLGGALLADMPAGDRARAIGYLPQGGELHWNLRVADVVALGREPYRGRFAGLADADRRAIGRAMEQADVAWLADRLVLELSGGERARVLLARVLAGEPKLLLADEPLANLDPRHQLETLRLFRGAADAGAAVVLVLHDLTAAAQVADRLLLLAEGDVLAQGEASVVLRPGILQRAYGVAMRVEAVADGGVFVHPAFPPPPAAGR